MKDQIPIAPARGITASTPYADNLLMANVAFNWNLNLRMYSRRTPTFGPQRKPTLLAGGFSVQALPPCHSKKI